jgi:hypothetical protein
MAGSWSFLVFKPRHVPSVDRFSQRGYPDTALIFSNHHEAFVVLASDHAIRGVPVACDCFHKRDLRGGLGAGDGNAAFYDGPLGVVVPSTGGGKEAYQGMGEGKK